MAATKRKPAPKSTAAETMKRVEAVTDKLVLGWSRADIIRFSARKWGVTRYATDRYISAANRNLAKSADVHRATELAKAIRRAEQLYRRAYNAKDYNTCRLIQKDLSDLLGLKVSTEAAKVGDIPTVRLVVENAEAKADG